MNQKHEQQLVEALAHLKAAHRLLTQVPASFPGANTDAALDCAERAVIWLKCSLDGHGVKLSK